MIDLLGRPTVRILTVKQPWASLIALGIKDIENRDWDTQYRGPFFVHAGLKWEDETPMYRIEQKAGRKLEGLPMGGIVGLVTLSDCVTRHPSKWFVGSYGFVLTKPRELPFMPLRGALGFRYAPDDVLIRYRRQLEEYLS